MLTSRSFTTLYSHCVLFQPAAFSPFSLSLPPSLFLAFFLLHLPFSPSPLSSSLLLSLPSSFLLLPPTFFLLLSSCSSSFSSLELNLAIDFFLSFLQFFLYTALLLSFSLSLLLSLPLTVAHCSSFLLCYYFLWSPTCILYPPSSPFLTLSLVFCSPSFHISTGSVPLGVPLLISQGMSDALEHQYLSFTSRDQHTINTLFVLFYRPGVSIE